LKALNPGKIHPPFAAYSNGVSSGDLLVTSGQLGISVDGEIPKDVEAQARLIFTAIDAILAEGNMDRRDVLRLNTYVTARNHMAGYMTVRDQWARGLNPLPASTLMIVSGFTRPDFLIEIEALAWRIKS